MRRIGRNTYFKALITVLLALAFFLAAAAAYAAGPVTFTVRRSPLRVKLLLPAKPVRGRPTIIRAVVRNVGNQRLKPGSVELRVHPRSAYSRAIKSVKVLPGHSRRKFTWRVKFRRARVYTLNVTAKARLSPSKTFVAGAQKRLRVKQARALSFLSLNVLFDPPRVFRFFRNLIFP